MVGGFGIILQDKGDLSDRNRRCFHVLLLHIARVIKTRTLIRNHKVFELAGHHHCVWKGSVWLRFGE